jgi:hypothetical protein
MGVAVPVGLVVGVLDGEGVAVTGAVVSVAVVVVDDNTEAVGVTARETDAEGETDGKAVGV